MTASRASSIELGDTDDKLDPRAGQKSELTAEAEMVPPHASADQASPAMLNEYDSDYVQIHTTTNGICELRPGNDGEINIAELEFLMPAPRALVLIKKNGKMLITPKDGTFDQPKCGWKAGKIVAVEETMTMDSSPLPLMVELNANRKREGSVGVFSNVPTAKRPMISAPSPVKERLTVVVEDGRCVSATEIQITDRGSHAEAKFPDNVSLPEASATSSASVSTTPETEASITASDSPHSDVNMSSMTVPMEVEISVSGEPKLIEASTVPPAAAAPFDNIAPTHPDETPSHSVLSATFVSIALKSLEASNTASNSTKVVNPPPAFNEPNSANTPESDPPHPTSQEKPVSFRPKVATKITPNKIQFHVICKLPDMATAAAPWIEAYNVSDLHALMSIPRLCYKYSVYWGKAFQENAQLFFTAFGPFVRYWGTDFVIDHLIFLRQMSIRDNEDPDRRALGTVLKTMDTGRGSCKACRFITENAVSGVLHLLSERHLLNNLTTGDVVLLKSIMPFIKKFEKNYRFMGLPE